MDFFKKTSGGSDHSFDTDASKIVFHPEQTGDIEDKIKNLWRPSLKKFPEIKEAYLVVADFGRENNPHPVLSLFPRPQNHAPVVDLLSMNFKETFGTDQFVDIIFMNKELQKECATVCKPFYIADPNTALYESLDDEKGLCKRCSHPFNPHLVVAFDTADFSKGGLLKCHVDGCSCESPLSFDLKTN